MLNIYLGILRKWFTEFYIRIQTGSVCTIVVQFEITCFYIFFVYLGTVNIFQYYIVACLLTIRNTLIIMNRLFLRKEIKNVKEGQLTKLILHLHFPIFLLLCLEYIRILTNFFKQISILHYLEIIIITLILFIIINIL